MAGFAFSRFMVAPMTNDRRVRGVRKNPVGNRDLSEKYAFGQKPSERKSQCNDDG
jgi:hypothetical protein